MNLVPIIAVTVRSRSVFRDALIVVWLLIAMAMQVSAQRLEPRYDPKGELERLDSLSRHGMAETYWLNEEDIRGRDAWFYFQRSFPYDMIPSGARQQAIYEIKSLERRVDQAKAAMRSKGGASIQAASQWEQIGPYNIVGGRAQGTGRVRAIAVHPTELGTIYIGTAAGGVWKNTGDPMQWTPLFDNQSAIAVNAIAIDPKAPSTLYVGTGEINPAISVPSASPAYLGDGIFKSTDNGLSWQNSGLKNVGAFSRLHVHNENSSIIYATATWSGGGFYRSTDAGQTWKGPTPSGDVFDMAVNAKNNNTIFISGRTFIRRSTDGGLTFQDVTTGVTGGHRISIAMGTSDTNVVYAMVARNGGNNGTHLCDMYRSTNRGSNWTKLPVPSAFSSGEFFNAQGWYNQCLAVYPEDADVVVAGGIDAWTTIDGGGEWVNTTTYYAADSKAHADQHYAVFDPASGVVYLSNDGGVYRSFDAGAEWEWMSKSLPITQFYSLDIDQTRYGYAYGGSQDNYTSGSRGSNGFDRNWVTFQLGDGFDCVVDMTDPDILYAENFNSGTRLNRIDIKKPLETTSIDGGLLASSNNDFGIWSTPLAQSPADKTTLYSGRKALWRSTNPRSAGNPTWQRLTPGNAGYISAIGLSPHDATKMIIGTTSGELRFSTTDGASWSASTGVTPRYITSLLYDPVNPGRVYVTTSGTGSAHVYRSDNDGASFTSISSNLPQSLPINTIEIDPSNTDHIFVGSDAGMFVTLDGGQFWFPFNDGFPLAPVLDMKLHRSARMLIAATHGRSMFQVSIDNITVQPLIVSPTGGETYSAPGKVPVRWAGFSGAVRVRLSFDGGGSYPVVVDNVSGGSVELDVPFVKTTNAVVRVEAMDGSVSVSSGAFSLTPQPNVTDLGNRGLRTGAIAVRGQYLWAAQKDANLIVKLRLPGLSPLGREDVPTTGITGVIRDMAYDATADVFYILTGNADYSNAKVYRMDTLGAAQGEVTLPTSSVSGIAMTGEGLVLITPGTGGKLYVIDPANGSAKSESMALENARGDQRAGLEWDGEGFMQGVSNAARLEDYISELQRIKGVDTARVTGFLAAILPSGGSIVFFGLAYNPGDSLYYATDTAGVFYRFTSRPLGVHDDPAMMAMESSIAIMAVTPNPMRGSTLIDYEVHHAEEVTIELYTPTGESIRRLFSGRVEAGRHSLQLDAATIPAGVYYVAMSNGRGERAVHSVVVMR